MRLTVALLGACILVAAGCGSQEKLSVPSPAEAKRALAGSPAPLAALHRQANEVLEGGEEAFAQRLAALRGRPVVVNAWASWCGPCRDEFPLFQRAAVGYGKRVAFVGVDVEDTAEHANAFLRDHWIAYPSYADKQRDIAREIGVSTGYPTTVFYDRDGKRAFIHQGPYRDEAALTADIRRYAQAS
jgi:thiol-disulfide isomerase/thioredoxin